MSERRRSTVGADARANPKPQWEVFVRERESAPLGHVGSVAAGTAEEAHAYADRLFPDALDCWCCRADAVARFTARSLSTAVDEPSAAQRAADEQPVGEPSENAQPVHERSQAAHQTDGGRTRCDTGGEARTEYDG